MNNVKNSRKRSPLAKVAISIVVIVVVLLVLAEVGLRWYTKDQITSELNQKAQESGVEQTEDPKVSFGAYPMLLGILQQKVPSFDLEIPSSIQITYEDNDQSKMVVTGIPKTTVKGKNLRLSDGDTTVGEVHINTVLPKELILSAVSNAAEEQSNDPMAGLIKVTDVTPNVDNQTLDLQISGGLANLTMTPKTADGQLTFDVDALQILGQTVPDSFTQSLSDNVAGTADQQLPSGMEAQDARVTDEGLQISMFGKDVNLDEVQNSLDEAEQGNRSAPGQQDQQPNQQDQTLKPGKPSPGAVGSGGEILNSQAA